MTEVTCSCQRFGVDDDCRCACHTPRLVNPLEGEPTVQLQVGVTRYGIYPEIMLRNRDGKPFGVLELVEHLRKLFRLTERRALEFVEKIRVEAPELLDD